METTITIEPDDIKRQIEKNIAKSELLQDKIEEVLESDEIKRVLTFAVKEILKTEKFNAIISNVVSEFIKGDFASCINEDESIMNAVNEHVINFINSKFK